MTRDNLTTTFKPMREVDERVFDAVASWHSPLLDGTMPELSVVATKSRLWMGIAALLAIFGGAKGRRTAIEGMVAIGANSFVVNIPLKSAVRRKRPTDEVPEERRLAKPDSYSFPSGHTASAAAFSGVVGRAYPKLWLPINALAAMVGFSRVYTGVHFPGDVLDGWIVGRGVAFVVNRVAIRRGLAPTQVD
ncbi:MAG: phosphatase PAP2 family protein [Actinomycetia bacterium]|nr:phosphatase PAP2 family protein [Actinomycetes bacterium]